jgi:hypothetical protein
MIQSIISATGNVLRFLGEQMEVLGIDTLTSIQKAVKPGTVCIADS